MHTSTPSQERAGLQCTLHTGRGAASGRFAASIAPAAREGAT